MTATLSFDFPLPRPHAGVPLGNGTMGVLVWGDGAELHLTVGRAGFWDHRGGNPFTAAATFAQVRECLEANDHARLEAMFGRNEPGRDRRPHQLGCGRVSLRFTCGHRAQRAELHTATGTLRVHVVDGGGRWAVLIVRMAAIKELAWIEIPAVVAVQVSSTPAWAQCRDELMRLGVAEPTTWLDGETSGGWEQHLPADPGLALAWRVSPGPEADPKTGSGASQLLSIATVLGSALTQGAQAAQVDEPLRERAQAAVTADLAAATAASVQWWHRAWRDLPVLELPDAVAQHSWDLGCYRFLAAVSEHGVPCTLQGPWLEDTQLPPWSCDYHFNINVQMIHLPGLALGRAAALLPLWRMIHGWLPGMRAAGQAFFGRDDALMLPHAVDDRCQAVGAFWTGMIDHACTGWMALLAYDHWRHSSDEWLLKEVVWPLLIGAHAGYAAMAEERDGHWSLPVTVSPEFRGCRPDAWGRDASFQLACWHAVVRVLPTVAATLNKPLDPSWANIQARLPAATIVSGPRTREYPEQIDQRIGLWAGMDLIESHRHHSHLAGVWPFITLDPASPEVRASMHHWVRMGAGAWSGWAVPWAATLCARMGWGDGALSWLHHGHDLFTNEGGATLHDGFDHGHTTLMGSGGGPHEIFQLDAGLGTLTAIIELLMQERHGVIHLAPALPRRWRRLRVDGLWCAGGLRVGFSVDGGEISEVRVLATRAGTVAIDHGLEQWSDDTGQSGSGRQWRGTMTAGQRLTLRKI